MTTVHASPDYRLRVEQPAPQGFPSQAQPDSYAYQPFLPAFQQRRQAYLEHVQLNPSPENTKAVYYELVRLQATGSLHSGLVHAALDYIQARKDCADFALHSILRLLYQFGEHPGIQPGLLQRAQETVLGFKYWPDEPGVDSLCTWTENHHILFASGAYLAGQLFPGQTFTNSGRSGLEMMARNQPRILRWLNLRFRTGFSEWLSHVYYDEDMAALLSLVDFCQDETIRQQARCVLDLLLLDMAANSFHGVFGSTHGRSYENTKKWASNEGTTDTHKLLFGMGVFSGFDNMGAACLALSRSYQPPSVMAVIANDLQRPEMLNRQRMGIHLAEAGQWGLGFDNFEDGMALLTLEAYVHPLTINLVMNMFDAFNWWENHFFAPFKRYRPVLSFLRITGLTRPLARWLEYDLCRNTREQVNIQTYRTPDYMLSSAQDYRKGYGGDQQHIWQATLGPDAVCFTTHPPRRQGVSPNYWTGSGYLPRAAQVKNVVIVLYRIEDRPALYVNNQLHLTHAWLPRDRFDEAVERSGWYFARLGDGYLALHSHQPAHWQEQPGEDQGREIIAPGSQNAWICELGRRQVDGDFADFIQRICSAELSCAGLQVSYQSPSQGRLEFGWEGALRQNGAVVPLEEYPRYDNPYVRCDFPAGSLQASLNDHSLAIDWLPLRREVRHAGQVD